MSSQLRDEYDTFFYFKKEPISTFQGDPVMSSTANFYYENASCKQSPPTKHAFNLKFSIKNERKILKVFLLGRLQKLFSELFQNKIKFNLNNLPIECYAVDSKIIQLLIQGIIETGEYTLEGIAYHTHIPFDVLYDAACGTTNQFFITPLAKIVDLYMQVKPDITEVLIDKLIEIKNNNRSAFSSLLTES